MPEAATLFVVQDDAASRETLRAYLAREGYHVAVFASAAELRAAMAVRRPDLLVLDMVLPNESGLEVCVRLRSQRDRVPIVLLTARSEAIERVIGLESGADDLIGKPFVARELLARIRALLRRASPRGDLAVREGAHRIGDYLFVPAARALLPVQAGGAMQALGVTELGVLTQLTSHPRVAQSREQLLLACHGAHERVTVRCIDVNIARLRRLVEPYAAPPRYIQTVRGHGYMFVPQAAAHAMA